MNVDATPPPPTNSHVAFILNATWELVGGCIQSIGLLKLVPASTHLFTPLDQQPHIKIAKSYNLRVVLICKRTIITKKKKRSQI